eukprot:NODE_1829_length_1365_cov_33.193861_g1737_i0.p1 GENE.NODE_1829_length_1365_cov_33.193861_g1737_i0~~NODE_1829_length_1365_cov_33.193861_g1737_i0.p1  ORF type:complete len:424 (+),score=105.59 NODE_1829_length_1365_cov_33.193861_g1737_i0:63-1274(+)
MAAGEDYYSVLGIPSTATAEEIKRAYRTLAVQWHPDKNPDKELAEQRFKVISEAYQVLSDGTQRQKYDRTASRPQPTPHSPRYRFKDPMDLFRTFFGSTTVEISRSDDGSRILKKTVVRYSRPTTKYSDIAATTRARSHSRCATAPRVNQQYILFCTAPSPCAAIVLCDVACPCDRIKVVGTYAEANYETCRTAVRETAQRMIQKGIKREMIEAKLVETQDRPTTALLHYVQGEASTIVFSPSELGLSPTHAEEVVTQAPAAVLIIAQACLASQKAQRYLLCFDGSEPANRVALHLLQSVTGTDTVFVISLNANDKLKELAAQMAARLTKAIIGRGITSGQKPVSLILDEVADLPSGISSAARSRDITCLVMGCSGNGLKPPLTGALGSHIMKHSHTPVLVMA